MMLPKSIKQAIVIAATALLAGAAPCVNAQDELAPEDALDLAAGGGWIVGTPSGARGSFGIVAGVVTNSVAGDTFLFGALNYIDHDTGLHVKSTGVTSYTSVDEQTREIEFAVEIDGEPGVATVVVSDRGEPGRTDTFEITLSSGYAAGGVLGGGRRGGGNIQVNSSLDQ